MKCYGCGKIIRRELTIDDLFKFTFYCDKCQKELEIKSIVFPLDEGYMGTYYYIFEKDVNIKLSKEKMKEVYMLIDSIMKKHTLIFIDKQNAEKCANLRLKENLNFFSFKFIDLEDFHN